MTATTLQQRVAIPVTFALATLALGVAVGFWGPAGATWLTNQLAHTPLPGSRLLDVAGGLERSWSVPIGIGLGVFAAAVMARSILHEGLKLTVAVDHVEYRQEDREGWIDRTEVARVHLDGSYVVMLTPQELVRARLNADGFDLTRLAQAFRAHGYPWEEHDPFDGGYERWMDGRPGFSEAEHGLLRTWHQVRRKEGERFAVERKLREANLAVRYRDGRVEVRRGTGGARGPDR